MLVEDIELITTGTATGELVVDKTYSTRDRLITIQKIEGEGTIGIKIKGANSINNENPAHYIAKDAAGNPAAAVRTAAWAAAAAERIRLCRISSGGGGFYIRKVES